MSRQLLTISNPHDTRQLLACDPASLQTAAIPLRSRQGQLLSGTFLTEDGQRSTIATQTLGLLCFSVNSDDCQDGDVVTVYTSGRFLWKRVREANPGAVLDPTAVATFKSKQISFEPTFLGVGNHWIGKP